MSLVLFICKYNNGRSQVAEAFFNNLAKEHNSVSAAGSSVGKGINSLDIKLMKEKFGIDMSRQFPKPPSDDLLKNADKIIIVCDPKDCILIPKSYVEKAEHWHIPELDGRSVEEKVKIMEEIQQKVKELISELAGEK